jgi:hypothetical protein
MYNADGFLSYAPDGDRSNYAYLQVFRTGMIESVDTFLLSYRADDRVIPSGAYEHRLIEGVQKFLTMLQEWEIEPPFFIGLSLLGVAGYSMAVPRNWGSNRMAHTIDRAQLIFPEVVADSYAADVPQLMRPVFDALWNATGWPRSFNYDRLGQWTGSS